jgi:hypothetical protein
MKPCRAHELSGVKKMQEQDALPDAALNALI